MEPGGGGKKKLGSKALGFGKKVTIALRRSSQSSCATLMTATATQAAKKAQERAQTAAAVASKQVQTAVTAELQEDDLRSVLRDKLIGGLGHLKELSSEDVYCVAPDEQSLDLWKTSLLPLRSFSPANSTPLFWMYSRL